MPSKSKQQQKFMGIVRSIQKGEEPSSKFSKAAQKAAKSMEKGSVRKYAKTKHDDLPKKVKEERDYKDEYKKFQSSTKAKKYRAELNKYNRKKGTYGNGDGKDASHKGGKIVGFESQSKNRGRAEKSRLKKEATLNENPAVIATAARMAIQNAKGKKVSVNTARQSKYASTDPSTHKKAKSIFQRIKDKFSKKKDDKPKKKSTPTTAADFRRSRKENVNEAMSESQRFKVYNSLKRGDIVSIKYDSSIQKGSKYIPYVVTKGKTKLMKGKIERIILKSPKNPRFKAYLYNRDGDVSLALGNMAASIVDMKKGKVKESVYESVYKFRGMTKTDMDEFDAQLSRDNVKGTPDFNKMTYTIQRPKKSVYLDYYIKTKYKKFKPKRIGEGFGGELEGSDKKKFENDRKKNGEQLGYTLTGESDVKETLQRVVKEEVSNIISERMDKRQAGETLKQLGGNKFIAMTGAKNFAVGPKGMGFRIGRNSKSINYIRIDLKSTDLYDMEFINIRGSKIKVVKKVTGVYNDQLQKMFTKYTGMYTSL